MKRILTVILLFLFCSQSFAFWWDTWSKKGTLYVVGGATKNVGIGTSEPLSLLHIAGTPSTLNQGLVFGDGDTGIAELLDDVLSFFIANSSKYYMGESEFRSSSASGFSLKTLSAISTIPNILPRLDDSNTGLGYITTDTFPMICGGVPVLTAKSVTGSAWVGIGNTNPAGALHVSTNYLFVSDAGNVGIGTTAPIGQLQVSANSFVVLNNGQVGIGTTTPVTTYTATIQNLNPPEQKSLGLLIQAGSVSVDAALVCVDTSGDPLFKVFGDGKLMIGVDDDTNLYRSAANVLKTDDSFVAAGGIDAGGSGHVIKWTELKELGDWNFIASQSKTLSEATMGITLEKIISIDVIIRNDNDTVRYNFLADRIGLIAIDIGSSYAALIRTSTENNGVLDTTDYDATGYNRGWYSVKYVDTAF